MTSLSTSTRRPLLPALRSLLTPDIAMAMVVLLIIAMMIVPLPKQVLDLLISANLAGSLVILLVSLYTNEPLQFAAFPSVLLLATLFRLGLNVLSTRLVLLQGDAGQVIHAFGTFVVGGSYVVGVVVFLILVIIQFVVITNGAGRVAEVAARFTLDAMPGKQMAIDADLNSGAIDEGEARRRRKSIEQEASFYGAMDGASKFVKGDAVAGVIIMVINILGGIVIGVLQRGLAPGEALKTYTILTVGDGLVSQLPALLISTATGILVTRAGSDVDLGSDLAGQMFQNPKILFIVAGVIGLLGLAPGMPTVPFGTLAALAAGGGYLMLKRPGKAAVAEPEAAAAPQTENENLTSLLQVDPLELEVGFGLVSLVDGPNSGLLSRITLIRRQIAMELGLMMPVVRIHDNFDLAPNGYRFKLRGASVGNGEVMADRVLALNPGTVTDPVNGIETIEPAFGLPALWVTRNERDLAEVRGYTIVDPTSVISTHFTETVRQFAHQILSRQDTKNLLDNLRNDQPAVVDEVLAGPLGMAGVHRVLQNLLKESVAIRDLVTVLETLGTYAKVTADPDVLTEFVRQSLGRSICARYVDEQGALHALMLEVGLQEMLMAALHNQENHLTLDLDLMVGQRLVQAVAEGMEDVAAKAYSPVLVVPSALRLPLRRYLEALPRLAVLSFGEIPQGLTLRNERMVTL